MQCKKCGSEIKNGDRFCKSCGTPIDDVADVSGDTEINSQKMSKNSKKWILLSLAVGALLVVTLVVKVIGSDKNVSLLSQLESKYNIEIPEIKAEGGSAVGNIVLEDYLPYEGNQRFTTMTNSTDGTEFIAEEMTMYLANGRSVYSLYSNLAEFTVQGVLDLDDSGEYYYIVQENFWDTTTTVTDIYIGLPEKTWTINNNSEKQIFIAPEFYTVSTPHGTYEKCLLKYSHDSEDSHEISAYAPNGEGEVISIGWSPAMIKNRESLLYQYTYNPSPSTDIANSGEMDKPDDAMIIYDLMDDEDAEFWMNGNGTDSLMFTMRPDGENTRVYMFSPVTNQIPYSGTIYDSTSEEIYVDGDPGCRVAKLNYISDGELELIIGDDIYKFYKN